MLKMKDVIEKSMKAVRYDKPFYKEVLKRVVQEFKEKLSKKDEKKPEKFREFQAISVAKVIYLLSEGFRRILVTKPTGSGKTIISRNLFSSQVLREVLGIQGERPLRLLFIANRDRLLQQARRVYDKTNNVEIITISTNLKDFPQFLIDEGWDITCLDEAHHESMSTFQLYLESITNAPLIGLTATPYRPDNCILKFEAEVREIEREESVKMGYLAESDLISIINFGSKNYIDFLKRVFHDFRDHIGQTIVAVKTKKEVKELANGLTEMGFVGVCAILDQKGDELNQILDDFSAGKYSILVNCNKINEGIDVANCDTVMLCRSYDSVIQLNQTIGRASRPDSGCTVFEIINPMEKKKNALDVVKEAKSHKFCFYRGDKINIYDKNTNELIESKVSLLA